MENNPMKNQNYAKGGIDMNQAVREKEVGGERIVRILRNISLFFLGAALYYSIEVAWRGYSHFSMAICGGLGMCGIYALGAREAKYPPLDLVRRCLGGMLIITSLEFVTGCIVNLWLGWSVWDYSDMPYQFLGQVCLPYVLLWFALSVPINLLCDILRRFVFEPGVGRRPARG